MHGQNNYFADNTGISGTDIWDGTTCPYLAGNANALTLDTPKPGEPAAAACDLSMGVPGGPKRYYHMGEVGGIAFGVRGEFSTRAVPVQSSDPGQANVTFTMGFPGNSNGVAPSQNFAGSPRAKAFQTADRAASALSAGLDSETDTASSTTPRLSAT